MDETQKQLDMFPRRVENEKTGESEGAELPTAFPRFYSYDFVCQDCGATGTVYSQTAMSEEEVSAVEAECGWLHYS